MYDGSYTLLQVKKEFREVILMNVKTSNLNDFYFHFCIENVKSASCELSVKT